MTNSMGGCSALRQLRSFLEFAYVHWVPPAPSFVLLVGDGNYDFKNIDGYNEPIFMPPYLDDVDPWIGETATDNRYVSISGDDILPDMYIGRFPARTPTEAQTMVEKTINYEQTPPVGGWNDNLTFIADNADSGGNFPLLSDNLINTFIPSSYSVDKVYFGSTHPIASEARAAIQTAINQGRLIVHYAGHGSTMQWAGTENLLNVSDLDFLSNGDKLPFILPMTCAEGYFIWSNPNLQSLGESIVRINGKGAIASWSPTGYGLSSGHDYLDQSLMQNLFSQNQNQLGYITTQAKYDLYAKSASYTDLIETFLLFGDPALRLQSLHVNQLFLPLINR